MSEAALRTTIPSAFISLDEAVFDPGAPTSAWLGAKLAQRDRWLHAHLRRGFSEAWPANQPRPLPRMYYLTGQLLGPYPWVATPGARWASWYIVATISVGWAVRVVPFAVPAIPQRLSWRDTDVQCVGTGSRTVYGPIRTDLSGLPAGYADLGLMLFVEGSATPITGTVSYVTANRVVSTGAADFAAISVPGSAIRVLDPNGTPLTEWSDVITKNGDSMVDAFPLFSAQNQRAVDRAGWPCTWELESTGTHYLHSVTFEEEPLSGRI